MNNLTQIHTFLLTPLHFTGGRFVDCFLFFPSCSKWQLEGGNCHEQNVSADFWTLDQADQSVWPGHHPHPQALPHGQPQYPGPVAPIHQPAPIYRPHQTSETGRQILTQSQMLIAEFVASDWNCLTMALFSGCGNKGPSAVLEKYTQPLLWRPHLNLFYMNPPEACQLTY